MPRLDEKHKNPTSASGNVDIARVYGWPAAILLNKLEYLSRYTAREDGFCFRTAQQLQDELALGEWELRSAVKKLEDAGIIETKNTYKVGTTTKCRHFRVLRDASKDYLDPERFLNKSGIHKSDSEKTSKSEVEETSKSIDSEKTSKSVYNNHTNNKKDNTASPSLSSVSTQNAESTASDRELSAPSPFEAPNTKRADEVNETPETNAPSSTSQSPAESENKLNNKEFAKKVYNRVQARLRRATATARKVGNTERMQYFADQLRLWRKPDKRATILSRIQWLLDADIYTQGQIENVLMDTVNGYYMRKEVNESGEEVEISVPNDLVRVLTQSDQDQMLWQLDKNFKITDEVIDELLGGEDDGEEPC